MSILFRRLILITIFTLIFPIGFSINSPKAKAETVSQTNANIVPGQILVKYKRPTVGSNSAFEVQSISPLIQTLKFPEGINVSEKITELQNDPNVEYAEPVYKFQISQAPQSGTVTQSIYYDQNNMSYMDNWGEIATQLTYAASITSQQLSSQVIVAVVDTGIDLTHPDLKDSIVQGYDFVNNKNTPQDDNGHGTNVAGIIAAKAHDISGYTGVAPGTKIMPIKVIDENGSGTTATIVAGIQYAIAHNANIINLSLGFYQNSKALHDVIKQAVQSNILVVAAAGNDSDNWINNESGQLDDSPDTIRKAQLTSYPALYDEVISVGAVEQLDNTSLTVADFSNTIKVDVAAPGVNIYSTYLNGRYRVMHGTSQATPFVAGLAALLKANNPNLSVDNLTAIIENSATPLPSLQLPYNNVNKNGDIYLTNFDFYGHGVINGQKPFQLATLDMIPDLSQLSSNTVSFMVYSEDSHGNIQVNNNSQVLFTSYLYQEDSVYRIDPSGGSGCSNCSSGTGGSVVNLVYGVGRAIFPQTGLMLDAYHYKIYFQDPTAQQIASNSIDLIKRPATPVSSINSGTFTGAQTVTLTSTTANADLYYVLDDGTTPIQVQKYSAPFSINKSSTLTTFSLKNHVYSDDSVYNYTFTPIVRGGGGGGGGGGSSSQSPPFMDADGKMTYELVPANIDLLIALSSDLKEVTLDARTKVKIDVLTAEVGADIFQKASERSKSIVINANDMTLTIPPNAFNVNNEEDTIHFKASFNSAPSIANFVAVSSIYDFSLKEKEDQITSFNTPIQATFAYDKTKVHNPHNLGVYVLDEQKGIWNSVGGMLNGDGTISASLPHFSKYAVLEKEQNSKGFTTFADIQNHWAQKEIEQLAGKQIIDGMDDVSFKPDSNMTRAQFVTLLSKALKLQSHGSAPTFSDVANDSWYKDSVYAAYQAKIVSGVEDNIFAPEENITREQMASMIVNAYLNATGKKLSDIAVTQEVKYLDEGSISDWARSYVRIASGLGLLNGSDEGNFAPEEDTSRAQAAVVIYRLLNKLNI